MVREQELEHCQPRLFGGNNGLLNKQGHHRGVCFSFFSLYLVEPLPPLNSLCRSASGPAAAIQAVGYVLVSKGKREAGNRAGYDLYVTLIYL